MRGHIYKRAKDSWVIVIDIGRGPDGKRHQVARAVKGTRADAEAARARLVDQYRSRSSAG